MKNPILLTVLGLLLLLAYLYYENLTSDPINELTALERTGDQCDAIAAKAAMHLPEALPFQRLEKAARQARVLQQCMNDRGYIENPEWVKYAQPITEQNAKSAGVSLNEAYETFKRKQMLTFKQAKNSPPYWVAKPS